MLKKIWKWIKNGGHVYIIMVLSLSYLLYLYVNRFHLQDESTTTEGRKYSWMNDFADFLLIFEDFTD